jgi:hypothetical protein
MVSTPGAAAAVGIAASVVRTAQVRRAAMARYQVTIDGW